MIALKNLLEEKGVTAYQMAKDTGIPESTLSKIKTGRQKGVSLKSAVIIAEYFQISVDDVIKIFSEENNEESKEIE